MQAAPRPPGGAAEGQPVQAVRSGAAQDGLVPGTQDILTNKNISKARKILDYFAGVQGGQHQLDEEHSPPGVQTRGEGLTISIYLCNISILFICVRWWLT